MLRAARIACVNCNRRKYTYQINRFISFLVSMNSLRWVENKPQVGRQPKWIGIFCIEAWTFDAQRSMHRSSGSAFVDSYELLKFNGKMLWDNKSKYIFGDKSVQLKWSIGYFGRARKFAYIISKFLSVWTSCLHALSRPTKIPNWFQTVPSDECRLICVYQIMS